MAELKVLAIHGCCLGDLPAERVSGGIRRSTINALKTGGSTSLDVKAPFYGELLNAYARGEIGLFEGMAGLGGLDEESLVGGTTEIFSVYSGLSEELAAESIEELRLPIPNFVREWAMHTFMADVSTYLSMRRAKEAIWGVITEAWSQFGPEGPDLVVAHSLGTVVVWDILATLGESLSKPKAVLMMGSPLYLGEVRANVTGALNALADLDNWIHIFDDGDLIAGGRGLSDHYDGVSDVEVENPAFPTSHDYAGYIHAGVTEGVVDRLLT